MPVQTEWSEWPQVSSPKSSLSIGGCRAEEDTEKQGWKRHPLAMGAADAGGNPSDLGGGNPARPHRVTQSDTAGHGHPKLRKAHANRRCSPFSMNLRTQAEDWTLDSRFPSGFLCEVGRPLCSNTIPAPKPTNPTCGSSFGQEPPS